MLEAYLEKLGLTMNDIEELRINGVIIRSNDGERMYEILEGKYKDYIIKYNYINDKARLISPEIHL